MTKDAENQAALEIERLIAKVERVWRDLREKHKGDTAAIVSEFTRLARRDRDLRLGIHFVVGREMSYQRRG